MADDVLTRNEEGALAVRTVASSGDSYVNPNDVYTRDENGNLAVRVVGAGGGDQHNLGYYATQSDLETAYPTAEAGDWAIVGETNTVWIWDATNSEWVDSDQKGQVTSVNGKTGAVNLEARDVHAVAQYSAMPAAGAAYFEEVIQYIGTTNANYTHGYLYECVSDGQNPATYSWVQIDVQPSVDPLPSQTGNSGKFLTTNGTDASWANALQNTATGTNSLTVAGNALTGDEGVNIGVSSYGGVNGVAVGYNANSGVRGVAIGWKSNGGTESGIAIGVRAKSNAMCAIQIGSVSFASDTTNSDVNTLKVANRNGNFEMMSADGTIPEARLADTTSATAGQVLKLDSNGNAVWASAATAPSTMPTLTVAGWSSNTQTVSVTGVTASNVVFVSPAPASAADYATAGILCTAQGTDSLTFTCDTVPSNDIVVNVVILG